MAAPSSILAGVEAFRLQGVGDVAGDADRDLAASVCMAGAVAHCAERRRYLSRVCAVVLAAERYTGLALSWLSTAGRQGSNDLPIPALQPHLRPAVLGKGKHRVLLPVVPAKRVGAILDDVRILRAVYDQQARLCVLLCRAAGCLPVRLEGAGHGRRNAERLGCEVVPNAMRGQGAGLE